LIALDSNKNVYVVDYDNCQIYAYDSDGNFIKKFGSKGPLIDQFHTGPMAILITNDDRLLVYEPFDSVVDGKTSTFHSVIQFDSYGNFINRVSSSADNISNFLWDQLIFTQIPDGNLIIKEDRIYDQLSSSSILGIAGYDSKTLTKIFTAPERNLLFSNLYYYGAVCAACDPLGNLWVVRPGRVDCMERQMRFDAYKPTQAVPLPTVLNVSQAPGSKVVDIDFRVLDSDSPTVDIGLVALVNGTRSWSTLVIPKTFAGMTPVSGALSFSGTLNSGTLASGSLSRSVNTGIPYRVSWNASADMPKTNFASLSFGVIARDARPEIGVHYVTIPAQTGASAFKISSKPVQENDLYDLWLWLLARGDSRVAVSGNTVILTASGRSYISGAPLPSTTWTQSNPDNATPFIDGVVHNGTLTTVQGRALAYKLINCRPVTYAEKTRVQAGRFNITAVNDNFVVGNDP
jgi:hypothetical protein